MPQVVAVVAAVVAVVTTAVSFFIKAPKLPKIEQPELSGSQTIQRQLESNLPRRVLVGTRIMGGAGVYDNSRTNNEYGDRLTVFTSVPVTGFGGLYLNGNLVTLSGDPTAGWTAVTSDFLGKEGASIKGPVSGISGPPPRVFFRLWKGDDNDSLGVALNSAYPTEFETTDKFTGCCVGWLVCVNTDDDNGNEDDPEDLQGKSFIPFGGRFPEARVKLDNYALCDPRNGDDYNDPSTWTVDVNGFSNSGLVDGMFQNGWYGGPNNDRLIAGMGYSGDLADIKDITQIIANANYCDTKGFECHGVISSGSAQDGQRIRDTFNGMLVEGTAKVRTIPEGNRPHYGTVDFAQIASAAKVTRLNEDGYSTEIRNSTRTIYAEAQENYMDKAIPALTKAEWVADDGGVTKTLDINLPYVVTALQAAKIEKADLFTTRLTATASVENLPMEPFEDYFPGGTITIANSDVPRINGRTFQIEGYRETAQGYISWTLREYSSLTHDFDATDVPDTTINLPVSRPPDYPPSPVSDPATQSRSLREAIRSSSPSGASISASVVSGVATVTVSAHDRIYADKTVSINQIQVAGLSEGLTYHIYYDDATRSLSNPTAFATTVEVNATTTNDNPGRHYVGQIVTNNLEVGIVASPPTVVPPRVPSADNSSLLDGVSITTIQSDISDAQTNAEATAAAALASTTATLQASDALLASSLATARTDFEAADTALNTAVDGLDIRLDTAEGIYTSHGTRLTNIETEQDGVIVRLDAAEVNIGTNQSGVANLVVVTNGQATSITALQTSDGTQSSQITTLFDTTATQTLSINNLTTRTDAAESSITSIQQTNLTQSQDILTLQTSDATQSSNITTLFSTTASQATAITALETSSATQTSNIALLFQTTDGQATSISQINARVRTKPNLFDNTDFATDPSVGPVYSNTSIPDAVGYPWTFNTNHAPPNFTPYVIIHPTGGPTTDWTKGQLAFNGVVAPSTDYFLSMYSSVFDCVGAVEVVYLDISGSILSTEFLDGNGNNTGVNGNTFAAMHRHFKKVTTPANCYEVRLYPDKRRGSIDLSYMWVCAPMLEVADADQTQPSTYSPGTANATASNLSASITTVEQAVVDAEAATAAQGTAIRTEFAAADAAIQGQVTTNSSSITTNATAISNEVSTRTTQYNAQQSLNSTTDTRLDTNESNVTSLSLTVASNAVTQAEALESVRAATYEGVDTIPDPAFYDDEFWNTPAGVTYQISANDFKSRRTMRVTGTGDFSSDFFPMEIGETYRIVAEIKTSSDFAGWFQPLLHIPLVAWHSPLTNSPSDPGATSGSGFITSNVGYVAYSFEKEVPSQTINASRQWQFRFRHGITAGSIDVSFSIQKIESFSEIVTLQSAVTDFEGFTEANYGTVLTSVVGSTRAIAGFAIRTAVGAIETVSDFVIFANKITLASGTAIFQLFSDRVLSNVPIGIELGDNALYLFPNNSILLWYGDKTIALASMTNANGILSMDSSGDGFISYQGVNLGLSGGASYSSPQDEDTLTGTSKTLTADTASFNVRGGTMSAKLSFKATGDVQQNHFSQGDVPAAGRTSFGSANLTIQYRLNGAGSWINAASPVSKSGVKTTIVSPGDTAGEFVSLQDVLWENEIVATYTPAGTVNSIEWRALADTFTGISGFILNTKLSITVSDP